MSEKLSKYILKRTTAHNRLNETYELGLTIARDGSQKFTFLARVEGIDKVYDDFQVAHNQIISLISDDDFKTYDALRITADKYFYGAKAIKNELLIADAAPLALNNSSTSQNKPNAKLPRINLPTFDGDFKKWSGFYDLFNTLIHENSELSNIEKFHYLLTSLEREPLYLIQGLPVNENNYLVAYETIEKRYQNKRLLATYYYNEISQASPVQKGTCQELRHILNIFSENIAALRALQFPVNHWDFLLFNMLFQKLDIKTRTDFELQNTEDIPTFIDLKHFLENKSKALASVQLVPPNPHPISRIQSGNNSYNKSYRKSQTGNVSSLMVSTDTKKHPKPQHASSPRCPQCSSAHALYRCFAFLSKSLEDKCSFVKQHNLCTNCLNVHPSKQCTSASRCKVCKASHHTLLHTDSSEKSIDSHSAQHNVIEPSVSAMASTLTSFQSTVLLSTAIIDIQDIWGHFHPIRVLFDTASMANFISEKCINRLGLPRQRSSIPIEGVNGMTARSSSGITQCTIKPCDQTNPTFSFKALVLPKICSDLPKVNLDPSQWPHIRNLKIADPSFHTPGPIDMLIGAELVPLFLASGRIPGPPGLPTALETVFGYILLGKTITENSQEATLLSCHISMEDSVDAQLQKFWAIEEVPRVTRLSKEDEECEQIFQDLTYRESHGRFVVPLPFRIPNPSFGDTYSQSYRFLQSLERRLSKNAELRKAYYEFMQDYLASGHMALVPPPECRAPNAYYIPHHCVVKNEPTGPKIRVVFNASFRGSKGRSLNDTLLVGPKLQRDIAAILLSFRYHAFVFICDIKQMYRQIIINPQHQDFQRILWRFSPDEPVKEYRLLTVTYGVSAAPYLALRTLQELADQEERRFPHAARVVRRDIYVDDAVTGSNDLESALQLQLELIELMKSAKLELRKWASNDPRLLTNIPSSDVQTSVSFDKDEPAFIKVLGLKWSPESDAFSYSINPLERPCTKRNILSELSRVFDPVGFLSPVILLAKCLLQKLWTARISWDDTPSEDILHSWRKYKSELPQLGKIRIPRRISTGDSQRTEIHGFCDASQVGYASVVYFRNENADGSANVFLVTAKCKVAPLKTISLPRLELCAAVLLADLVSFVRTSFADFLAFDSIYLWSDSSVTLAWLAASPHRWKTFVANRVSHVQDLLPQSNWRYVPSAENPADCASRGLTPAQLLDHALWWHGPDFLLKPQDCWPQPLSTDTSEDAHSEEKLTALHVDMEEHLIDTLLNKFSSLKKIRNVLAYVLRVISRPKPFVKSSSTFISPTESFNALKYIVRHVQATTFPDILSQLNNNRLLPKPLRKLAPFVDSFGLIRVGGRLRNSNMPYDTKHPMLLPKSHRLTDLVVELVHHDNFHPGLKTMHYLLLQHFWILSPRSSIYKCLSRCIRCFRCKPKSYNPYMSDLPSLRVSQLKAFSAVCIDFAGPFSFLVSRQRKSKTTKGYVCVFVCSATKAIHLEAVSDLTSEAFLAAFRRFVARRGRCSNISSDQGTNFVGANRQLIEYAQGAAEQLSIHWHFNPPGSPHFNGLAESGVKSFKSHLTRTIGAQLLTFEEFYTLLTQIEALLNSRPLCAVSTDPNDLEPLTPGHFLTLEPLKSGIYEPDLSNIKLNRLSRWQLLQRMHRDFWKRWSQEYIHTLQQRSKWMTQTPSIQCNSLVLIKHDSKPPLQWELGRVVELHSGKDGVVRVVTVKTVHGLYQRPVVKICPLPGN